MKKPGYKPIKTFLLDSCTRRKPSPQKLVSRIGWNWMGWVWYPNILT